MAIVIPFFTSFNRESIIIQTNLVLLNDSFELVLPFPVRVMTNMTRALGTTAATTTAVVSGTNVIGTDGKGINFQTLQTLSTLGVISSISTSIVSCIKAELTALTGVGGVELTLMGALY